MRQICESAFSSKQAGVKQYLLEQQQMRWQLNTKIKDFSDKESNILRNEKWGVCQNITKFIASVNGCKSSDDVVKCESCLTTINDTLKSSADLLSFIDSMRKVIYREDQPEKIRPGYTYFSKNSPQERCLIQSKLTTEVLEASQPSMLS